VTRRVITLHNSRVVARNLFWRGTEPRDWGQKSPSGVQGQNPDGGLGIRPQKEAEDIYANNNCNNALTNTLPPKKNSAWEFPGGHVPYVPPSLRPCTTDMTKNKLW